MQEFWVMNITKKDIVLYDLNVTIRSFKSVNLLDKRHRNISMEEINKSLKEGDLFNKSKMLILKKAAPKADVLKVPLAEASYIPSKERSGVKVREPEVYEELEISDDEYAEQNADDVENERQPILSKK